MTEDLVWHSSGFASPDSATLRESIPSALLRAAKVWRDRPAVMCGTQTYSYNDLACRASSLSTQIVEAYPEREPVALVQSVGFDAVAAWFACAMARRPMLLLEPDHPPARLLDLMKAAGCKLVLCDSATAPLVGQLPGRRLLVPDNRRGDPPDDVGLPADQPAFIFPTSGSTGTPKLVAYAATTLAAKVQGSILLMRLQSGARVVIAGSHGNYGFLHHAFVFLMSGGTVCLADVKAGGFRAVVEAISSFDARHVRFTPSLFRKIARWPQATDALLCLDAVRFSGEPLLTSDLDLAKSVLRPGCLIQNVYGSTESALFLWSNDDPAVLPKGPTVPVGRIYPLSSYAIVARDGFDTSDGTGELIIRSPVNALGDFRTGSLDRARFPLCEGNPQESIYTTGDIVRSLPDGNLLHLGRTGRMVKIRGYRVFLTEVENSLRNMPGITGAAVVERTETDDPVLCAFITTDESGVTVDDARAFLRLRLPDFMQPRHVAVIDRIPTLPGGKTDYQKLLLQVPEDLRAAFYVSDEDGAFGNLVRVWDGLLWDGAHSHDAEFLSLGGDSLKLMTLSLEVERTFGQTFPLEAFLVDSSLRNLAVQLGIEPATPPTSLVAGCNVRLVWPKRRISRGIALAMPGWGGKAMALPFARAGLFPRHDLWAADYQATEGPMQENGRWLQSAQQIASGITQGTIPTPDVIFGYSLGGGVAWLVARLLAGSSFSPKFVVMVDAAPLHRLGGVRCKELHGALANSAKAKLPPVIHIRRAPFSVAGLHPASVDRWQAEDQIRIRVDLPTLDHLEMSRHDMLELVQEPLAAFLDGQYGGDIKIPRTLAPEIFGVRMYRAITGDVTALDNVLTYLLDREPNFRFNAEHLPALLLATALSEDPDRVPALVDFALETCPASRMVHYISQRLRRDPRMLFPNLPSIITKPEMRTVEAALVLSKQTSSPLRASPFRIAGMAIDVAQAVLSAKRARIGSARP